MENSKIEWTDHTFNPWIGCTKVSPGCTHCYAEAEDKRRKWTEGGWGKGKPRHLTSENSWRNLLKWNDEARASGRRKKVFCASLCDVFDDEVVQEWRDRLWDRVAECQSIDFQVLTKRPENIPEMLPRNWNDGWANVWLGTSVENQDYADIRIPLLCDVSAKMRFLSVEPLLGPIHFKSLEGVNWVIVGGESGVNSRLMDKAWVEQIKVQCETEKVTFFFKQWGAFDETAKKVGKLKAGHTLNGETLQSFPESVVNIAPDPRAQSTEEINLLHGEIVAGGATALQKAFRIGEHLVTIKSTLRHGRYGVWIKDNLTFDQRTAERYVEMFKSRDKLKFDTVSNLASAFRFLEKEKRATRAKNSSAAKRIGETRRTKPVRVVPLDAPKPAARNKEEEPVGNEDEDVSYVLSDPENEDAILLLQGSEELIASVLELARKFDAQIQYQVIRKGGPVKLNDYFAGRIAALREPL